MGVEGESGGSPGCYSVTSVQILRLEQQTYGGVLSENPSLVFKVFEMYDEETWVRVIRSWSLNDNRFLQRQITPSELELSTEGTTLALHNLFLENILQDRNLQDRWSFNRIPRYNECAELERNTMLECWRTFLTLGTLGAIMVVYGPQSLDEGIEHLASQSEN